MKNLYWIAVGLIIGLCAGLVFGTDYAIAGAAIGAIGGFGIYIGMRGRNMPPAD